MTLAHKAESDLRAGAFEGLSLECCVNRQIPCVTARSSNAACFIPRDDREHGV